MLRTLVAIALSRALRKIIRLVRPGGGSSVPGRLAAIIQPNLVTNAVTKLRMAPVLVSGSAGKSTTTKLVVDILRAHGLRVFTNPSTSNIRQGFFSAVLTACDLRGRLNHDIAVIEADEGHGPALARALSPQLAVFTNLMSDQLDRFVDPDFVAAKLLQIAQASESILINSDDLNLQLLAERAERPLVAIGSSQHLRSAQTYPKYAFVDQKPTRIPQVDFLLQDCSEDTLVLSNLEQVHTMRLLSPGIHMALNTVIAVAASSKILGKEFDWGKTSACLQVGEGVFARWESVSIRGIETRLVLVQNPGSFQVNLKLIEDWPSQVFFGIGRDVHDPSWLWTVDISNVPKIDVLGGFNASEAAARFITAGVPIHNTVEDIPDAVEKFLNLAIRPGDERIMVITADAMRRVRRHLRLAK